MVKRKLFAFDMDGTLLNSKNKIHPENLEVIKAAKNRGHVTVLASGRSYNDIKIPFEEHGYDLSIFDWMVCNNGAYFYYIKTEEFEYKRFVDLKVIKELMRFGTKHNMYFAVHKDGTAFRTALGAANEKTIGDPDEFIGRHEIFEKEGVIKMALEGGVVQASLRGNPKNILAAEKYFEQFKDDASIAVANELYLDANPIGVNKLTGVAHIASKYDIDIEDVVAYGDSGNDVEMLKGVGYGVAMDNATEEAKAVADEVIGNNDTNAISQSVIEVVHGASNKIL